MRLFRRLALSGAIVTVLGGTVGLFSRTFRRRDGVEGLAGAESTSVIVTSENEEPRHNLGLHYVLRATASNEAVSIGTSPSC